MSMLVVYFVNKVDLVEYLWNCNICIWSENNI